MVAWGFVGYEPSGMYSAQDFLVACAGGIDEGTWMDVHLGYILRSPNNITVFHTVSL